MKITTTNFRDNLKVEKNSYNFVSLKKAEKKLNFILEKLPFSYKILLENLIRNIDSTGVKRSDLENYETPENLEPVLANGGSENFKEELIPNSFDEIEAQINTDL